jgi:glutamine synthetase adenylyltransferase
MGDNDDAYASELRAMLRPFVFRRYIDFSGPAVAKRSQAHVHPIDKAVLRRLVERLDQPLSQAATRW